MLNTCSEVVWRVLATHSIRQFPLHFPSRPSPCAITFQLGTTFDSHNGISLRVLAFAWRRFRPHSLTLSIPRIIKYLNSGNTNKWKFYDLCKMLSSPVTGPEWPRGFQEVNVPRLRASKCKAVPLQAWTGPEGSRKLRFPDYVTTAQDGSKVVSLTQRPPLTPRKYSWYSFLLEAEWTPGP